MTLLMAGEATISHEIESHTPCSPLLEKGTCAFFESLQRGPHGCAAPVGPSFSLRSMVK